MRGAGLVLAKDLRMGPRSPVVLWALVLPVAITLLVRGVFGSLFEANPRLGIVDEGASEVTAAAREIEGIDVTLLDDPKRLRDMVERNDLDAGLVLQPDFDAAVRAGRQPELRLFVSGESLASSRLVIAVTTIDLVRAVEGSPSPVEVEITSLGEATPDLTTRLMPLLVIMAIAVAGAFVPAASLVEEKEAGTLDALLVSPATMSGVLVGKALFGALLAMATGVMTLALNGAFGTEPVGLVAAMAVGAIMMAEVGLLLGCWARDTNTMFTAWKGGGILLFFPVIFYIWPSLPQWIAKLGPTYWFLQPIYDLALREATLADVRGELLVGVAICAVLVGPVAVMGRRLQVRHAGGAVARPERRKVPAGADA